MGALPFDETQKSESFDEKKNNNKEVIKREKDEKEPFPEQGA